MSELGGEGQWIGRPWVARAIRVFVLVVPFAASVGFAWTLSGVLPTVSTWPMAILRWLLIAAASTAVMVAFDRVTRRLLPLAVLLSLTLAFPDQAPSRFRVAMRIGTTLQLRKIIADARAGRIGETPAEAAEKLLELVGALSVHDRLTRGHSERVRAYTHMVGEELKITGAQLDHLRWSALLHDIGKLLVSAEILNKPGKLSDAEFEAIKQHPEFGRELVAPLVGWLGDAARAVWEHHERWDGRGYPRGLSGSDISLAGRVVAVTDAFDVMTSARSYKDPISPVAARAELARCAGTQFDEAVVRAFLNVSLGRLRMAMGPLSWLTQLSFVPQALVTAGVSGATAATAVVGLAAGAIGVGLNDDSVFADSREARTEAGPTIPIDDVIGQPRFTIGTGPIPDTGGGVDDDGVDGDGVDTGEPVADDGVPGADAPIGGDSSTTTTSSVPGGGRATPSPVTVPSGIPTGPGSGTAPTTSSTTPRSTGTPTTTATASGPTTTPAPGVATTVTSATTAPTTTTTTTSSPTTTSTTTSTTTTTTTTTIPGPTPMGNLTLFLKSYAAGDVVSQGVLPLATNTPTATSVPNYDTDRDSDPGLTLDEGEQLFRWVASSPARFVGSAGARLWISGPGFLVPGNLEIEVQLRRCTGVGCTILATRPANTPGPLLVVQTVWTPVTLDFGAIDLMLAAGDSLELIVTGVSSREVWLAYDTSATASRFTFVPS